MKRFLTLLLLVGVCLFASAQSITIHHKDGKFHLPTQKVDSISFNMKYMNSMDTTLLHKHITVIDTTVNQVVLNDTLWRKISVNDTVVNQVVLNDTLWNKITMNDTIYNHVTINDTVDYLGGHRFVDLGLSVKWATCNVGANNPESYGLYFMWGETTGYSTDTSDGHYFSFTNYKWYSSTDSILTKYCFYEYNGPVDSLKILEPADDAATVNWGSEWRMPSVDELKELSEKCTWTWMTQNGVNGFKVIGANGNSIFLPAAGYRVKNTIVKTGETGFYWSNSIIPDITGDAMEFDNEGTEFNSNPWRYCGIPIRPVCSLETKNNATCSFGTENYTMRVGENYSQALTTNSDGKVTYSSSDPTIATVDASTGIVTALKAGSVVITANVEESDNYKACSASYGITVEETVVEHDYVDLGLSVKWATCNLGAEKPEDYGSYFAWGETTGYEPYTTNSHTFSWENYKWCGGTYTSITKYNMLENFGTIDNKSILDNSDDAAAACWGGSWRMPTSNEQNELITKCYWEYTKDFNNTGKSGYIVYKAKSESDMGIYNCTMGTFNYKGSSAILTSSYSLSDTHIFLPSAGYCDGDSVLNEGSQGLYWSSSLNKVGAPYCAVDGGFRSIDVSQFNQLDRCFGLSVRAVF